MMRKKVPGEWRKERQFNMRLTADLWRKLQQLAVDRTVRNKRVTLTSEVMRSLIEEEWKRRGRKLEG